MISQPAIVCDIDNTVADNRHREHLIPDWEAWHARCHDDVPYWDIVKMVKQLQMCGSPLLFATSRNNVNRQGTYTWLEQKPLFRFQALYMRKEDDRRPCNQVKLDQLKEIRRDGWEPWIWIDDDLDVCAALHEAGVRVLQVRPPK